MTMKNSTKIYGFLGVIILILLALTGFFYFNRNRQIAFFNDKILSSMGIDGKVINFSRINNDVVKYMIYFEKNKKINEDLSHGDRLDERGVVLVLEVLEYGLPFKFFALYRLDGWLLNVFYSKIPISDVLFKNIISLYRDNYEFLPNRVEYHIFNALKIGAQFVRTEEILE